MAVSPHSDSTTPPPSQPMGQYYLLEKIARGGMAEIYKGLAYDLHGIKRTVVIKKILPQAAANREFIDMLIAEAKIAVMLSHGNIAQIYDLGKSGDDFFIVMEYVEGRSMSQLQRECATRQMPIPIPIACHLCAEVASGLDYMHQRTDDRGQPLHIVHRDVSPQNVLISYSGTVKIIDFGIAKARTKLEDTEIGILKGKFAYMSPEHASGDPIDHRSDIFSLGVILHEMLTGKRLFKAKENRETLKNVRRAEVPPPSSLRADIPAELDALVLRALAKERADRYPRAALLRDELHKILIQHYPQFRDHQLADFLKELFVAEAPNDEEEPENKTPFLIIDHTQSAISGEDRSDLPLLEDPVPSMMAEFMLPSAPEATVLSPQEQDDSAGEAIVEETEQSVTMSQPVFAQWPRSLLWILLCGLLGGAWWWQQEHWSSAAWWHRMFPAMDVRQVPADATPAAVASFTITSTPPGATIYLDDVETGLRTPAVLTNVIPNRAHTIGVHLYGYQYWSAEKTVAPATHETLSVGLEIDYGRLTVVTTPAGAQVSMNGRVIGLSPLQYEMLRPGEIVEVTLALPGYESVTHTSRVQPGHTIDIRQALERIRTKVPR